MSMASVDLPLSGVAHNINTVERESSTRIESAKRAIKYFKPCIEHLVLSLLSYVRYVSLLHTYYSYLLPNRIQRHRGCLAP